MVENTLETFNTICRMPLCGLWAKNKKWFREENYEGFKHILGLKTLIGIEKLC